MRSDDNTFYRILKWTGSLHTVDSRHSERTVRFTMWKVTSWTTHLILKATALRIGRTCPWTSYQIRRIAGCACAGNAGNVFPPRVSDPDLHHGTCVTHVPWCIPGSLTSGFLWRRWWGKRPRLSRRMRNPQFSYLVRGPWADLSRYEPDALSSRRWRQFLAWWPHHHFLDNKVHGANMGPIWGRQDPGGPHVGPMNFDIWVGLAVMCRLE